MFNHNSTGRPRSWHLTADFLVSDGVTRMVRLVRVARLARVSLAECLRRLSYGK